MYVLRYLFSFLVLDPPRIGLFSVVKILYIMDIIIFEYIECVFLQT